MNEILELIEQMNVSITAQITLLSTCEVDYLYLTTQISAISSSWFYNCTVVD